MRWRVSLKSCSASRSGDAGAPHGELVDVYLGYTGCRSPPAGQYRQVRALAARLGRRAQIRVAGPVSTPGTGLWTPARSPGRVPFGRRWDDHAATLGRPSTCEFTAGSELA